MAEYDFSGIIPSLYSLGRECVHPDDLPEVKDLFAFVVLDREYLMDTWGRNEPVKIDVYDEWKRRNGLGLSRQPSYVRWFYRTHDDRVLVASDFPNASKVDDRKMIGEAMGAVMTWARSEYDDLHDIPGSFRVSFKWERTGEDGGRLNVRPEFSDDDYYGVFDEPVMGVQAYYEEVIDETRAGQGTGR